MKMHILFILLLASAACGPKQQAKLAVAKGDHLAEIQKIAAVHLKKPVETLSVEATFASNGADELDLVEITMAVEESLGITIEDADLARAAGASSDENLAGRLTLRAFAAVAATAPKRSTPNLAKSATKETGDLREAQVGTYGELSRMTNPKGYEFVFVPSLELLTADSEQKLGKRLSEDEREAIKLRAVVVALPPAIAERVRRKQAERKEGEIR